MEEYINCVLRPKIQGDGGEITFDSQDGDNITVIMQGECSKCLILNRCISWIEEQIEKDLRQKVTVTAIRKKPFFWDT
ncbi:MAG: NifU family protein [Clostridiales bacterium]|nr:NifU family protein [Clostridiales bacterium]MCD7827336.1 NifU family protein [Clostridiales bacterium]